MYENVAFFMDWKSVPKRTKIHYSKKVNTKKVAATFVAQFYQIFCPRLSLLQQFLPN